MANTQGGLQIRELRAIRAVVESAVLGVAAVTLGITLGGSFNSIADATSGTSSASAEDPDNVYARLPAYPAPFTPDEMQETRAVLADANASLDRVRADTDAMLLHMLEMSRQNAESSLSR